MKGIDVDKVELACNDDGCVLIPDDGIAENDVTVDAGGISQGLAAHIAGIQGENGLHDGSAHIDSLAPAAP